MPWYDSILSPLRRAWEREKAIWREIDADIERAHPWEERARKEIGRISWEAFRGRIPYEEAMRLIDEIKQRRADLLKQFQGPANE